MRHVIYDFEDSIYFLTQIKCWTYIIKYCVSVSERSLD